MPSARARARTRANYDDARYRAARAQIQAADLPCWHGCGRRGTTVDHVPPLRDFPDPAQWTGELRPACRRCNQGWRRGERKTKAEGQVHYRRRR